MQHPKQREMWYLGCLTHIALIMIILTFMGWLIDG
jgi:hypothetical protein